MATKEELASIINEVLDDNPGLGSDELAERISQRAGLGLGYNNKFVDIVRGYKNSRSGLEAACNSILELSNAKIATLGDGVAIRGELRGGESGLKAEGRSPLEHGEQGRDKRMSATRINAQLVSSPAQWGRALYFKWDYQPIEPSYLTECFNWVIFRIADFVNRSKHLGGNAQEYANVEPGKCFSNRVIYSYNGGLEKGDMLESEVKRHARFLLCELVKQVKSDLNIDLSVTFYS